MTATLERPPTPADSSDYNPRNARRAIVRWSLRLYKREWRQQILALSLLVVAVAATTVGLGLVGNIVSGEQSLFGTANTRVDVSVTASNVNIAADLSKARQLFGSAEVIEHASIPVPGSITPADLRSQALQGAFSSPMLRVTSGRYPSKAGEVAVTSGIASTFNLTIGSLWTVDGQRLRVVGAVENPTDLQDDFALVAPGQIAHPTSASFLFNSSNGRPGADGFRPSGVQAILSTDTTGVAQRRTQSLLVLVLSTIGMVFVGLLSVAGFTVMAQRRMRALGMIGAIGATDRQVRLVMLSNGAAVGVLGALAGTVVGLVTWFSARPAFEHLVGHRVDAMNVQWWAVAVDAVLAVITAVVAAWWPARSIARTPIVAALSGRPAKPQPAHRFGLAGFALLAAAFGLLVYAHEHTTPLVTVLGIIATVAGILMIAPLGIRVVALVARHSPIATRLALRDLARYQARSSAALAAVSLAIGIAATIAVSAAGQATLQSNDIGNLPSNQLAVWIQGGPTGAGPVGKGRAIAGPAGGPGSTSLTAAQLATAQRTVNTIATDVHAQAKAEVDQAFKQNVLLPDGSTGNFPVNVVREMPRGFEQVAQLFVATPDVLALYHLSPSAITDDVITSDSHLTGTKLTLGPDRADLITPTIQVTPLLPRYGSAPNTLISQQYATSLGLVSTPTGWLLQTSHALTAAEITAARNAAATVGLAIETRNTPNRSLTQLRNWATAIGVLVALGVLIMTVGLIRSETANDLRTLSATGASGMTRRTLTAATAGALALLGGLLGTAGCYIALSAWFVHDFNYLSQPPLINLLIIIVGLPAAAVTVGWLTAFRAPTGLAQRPLE
jgi:putative ABC transport system permease protein